MTRVLDLQTASRHFFVDQLQTACVAFASFAVLTSTNQIALSRIFLLCLRLLSF